MAERVQRPVWTGRTGPLASRLCAGVMGIVNLTPDSFFDGGRHDSPEAGLAYARRLVQDGADMLDLGGESSRPGARPVTAAEEAARVLPVLKALKAAPNPPAVSVDTCRASTAVLALEAGCDVINDISAQSFDPGLTDVLVQYRPGYVLMHCQGTPATMQSCPRYADPASEVAAFFERELSRLVRAGFPEENVILDPGIGFGKKAVHNLALIRHPEAWAHLGRPSLMGLSMKSLFKDLLGLETARRGTATQVATALALVQGYAWHRVHDVQATSQTIALFQALSEA